ncbi:carboxypeptidase regulatory-like domain-containing protein [Vreelandella nanhaiensis]|uniref:Carboxypeptidase regulatory-like domain-containing protein n=1 Tax=Vreelandella nanhaiensis TaxID=1258546 RepID=A0A433KXR3_9GAMM|nr:carboxypeptidase regulatory-like domain-containing protein [Halomonas nanhaiensis]RUR34439.1 carboxypeptidase regulatory-like domain-containing protein [Halomonas nanhaiensis]
MKLLILTMTLLLSGCVIYPINKTLQPDAEILVTDVEGNPIQDAWVYLISSSYPYGFEQTRRVDKTSYRGEASFPEMKEWRTESLMIQGSNVFFWNWCVVKAGFETHSTVWSSGQDFQPQYNVILTPGKSTPCPEEPNKIGCGL